MLPPLKLGVAMLHQLERYVFFHEIVFSTAPEAAEKLISKPYTLPDIYPALKSRIDAGNCVKLINNDTGAVRILKAKKYSDPDCLALLFAYADKNSANPAFMNIITGKTKILSKGRDEGGAFTAHLVINMAPTKKGHPVHAAILEKVPGVTKSVIEPFFNTQMRELAAFKISREGKRPLNAWPTSELLGQPSAKLKEEVSAGELQSVELVRYEYKNQGIDEIGGVAERTQSLSLKVNPEIRGNIAIAWLNKVKSWGSQNAFPDMKVRYKSRTGKVETIPVPTVKTDVGDFNFTRHELIKVVAPLGQFEEDVRDDLVAKMKAFL